MSEALEPRTEELSVKVSPRVEQAIPPEVIERTARLTGSTGKKIGILLDQGNGITITEEVEKEEESLLALIEEHEEIFEDNIMVFEIAKLLGENYDDTKANLSSRGITSNEIYAVLASNQRLQRILASQGRTTLQYVWGKIRSLKRMLREINLEVVSVKRVHEIFYSLKKSSTVTAKNRKDTKDLETEIEALRSQVRKLIAARVVDAKDLRSARAEIAKLRSQLDQALQDLEKTTAQAHPGPAPAKGPKSCVDILIENISAFDEDEIFDIVKCLAEAADSKPTRRYSAKDIKKELNDEDLDEESIKNILAPGKLIRLNAKLSKFGLKIVEYKDPVRYALKKI